MSPVLGAAEQMSEPSLTCHSTQMALVTGRGHWDKNESAEHLLRAPWESPSLERGSVSGQREELSSAASVTPPRSTRELKPGWSVMVSCLPAGGAAFIPPVVELGLKLRHFQGRRTADGCLLAAPPSSRCWNRPFGPEGLPRRPRHPLKIATSFISHLVNVLLAQESMSKSRTYICCIMEESL